MQGVQSGEAGLLPVGPEPSPGQCQHWTEHSRSLDGGENPTHKNGWQNRPAQDKSFPSCQRKLSKQLENEINKITQFTTASKRIKYQGINARKQIKTLYFEKDIILLKEIKGLLD